jgi:hypothetical protein
MTQIGYGELIGRDFRHRRFESVPHAWRMIGELEDGRTFIAHISFQAKLALITDCYFKTVVHVAK